MNTSFSRSFCAKSALVFSGAILAASLFAAPFSFARPEMAAQSAADRFAAMDADKNGALSREEFFAAQPHMKEAAFEAIDTDKNGSISQEEWLGFVAGHGKDMPSSHPGSSLGGKDEKSGDAKPGSGEVPQLIMPPRSSQ